jgi:hypothetical protein
MNLLVPLTLASVCASVRALNGVDSNDDLKPLLIPTVNAPGIITPTVKRAN